MKPRTTLPEDVRRRMEFVHQDAQPQPDKPQPAVEAAFRPLDRNEEEPTVNQAYRLPRSLVNRLRRAVLARKTAGVKPSSANAIAEEALARWLDDEEKTTRMQ